MTFLTVLGLTAATLTTAAFFPQVLKTWKYKRTDDISLVMYIVLCAGIILWTIYGILISDLPIILANSITLVFALTVLGLKIKYG